MKPADKIDLFKQLKSDYKQTSEPVLLESTAGQYLAVNGRGKPGGEEFQRGVEALYSMAYTIKMTRKAEKLGDYVVCKLEALWWVDGSDDLAGVDQDLWQWKVMIRTPDCVADDDVEKAVKALRSKGKADGVESVGLDTIDEGRCVQMLHVGPYEKEPETVAVMQAFMAARNWQANGPHHEIYISDPRRIKPDRLKTIIRQPVRGG